MCARVEKSVPRSALQDCYVDARGEGQFGTNMGSGAVATQDTRGHTVLFNKVRCTFRTKIDFSIKMNFSVKKNMLFSSCFIV